MTDNLSVADVMALQNRDNCCYNNGNGGFGNWGDGGWIFLLFILLIVGRGWGGFGGYGGFGSYGVNGADFQGVATRADINGGFAFNNLQRGVQGIQQGICDSTYALNNSIMNGFHGVDNAVCQLGYQNQQGFSNLSSQLANCCCTLGNDIQSASCATQRAIDGVNYNLATQSCDTRAAIKDLGYNVATLGCNIIQNQHNDTDRVIAKLNEMESNRKDEKIAYLTSENNALKFQASQSAQNAFITANQEAQTAELIRRLGKDCPQPAFLVPDPNCCYGPFGNFYNGNGYNNCGCNSCC